MTVNPDFKGTPFDVEYLGDEWLPQTTNILCGVLNCAIADDLHHCMSDFWRYDNQSVKTSESADTRPTVHGHCKQFQV